jgi:hypothetical protein
MGTDPYTRYIELFVGRVDDYAEPFPGGWLRTGRGVTASTVEASLAGTDPSLSFYVVAADGSVRCPAVDFDTDGTGITKARVTAQWLRGHGVGSVLEPSRKQRAHLFVPLDGTVQAAVARRCLITALDGAGIDHVNVEVFPKTDHAPAAGQVGACLRGPLMTNPKDGSSYPLLDPRTMRPLGATFEETMAAIVPADLARVIALAGPEPEPEDEPERDTPEHIQAFNEAYPCSEVLQELWHVPNAEPGRSVRCPAHDDLHPSLSIFEDDRRVLCWSPDCPLSNDGRGRDAWDLFGLAPMPERQP